MIDQVTFLVPVQWKFHPEKASNVFNTASDKFKSGGYFRFVFEENSVKKSQNYRDAIAFEK